MADGPSAVAQNAPASMPGSMPSPSPVDAAPKQNPVFRMLGMPNIRPKLPSRNWLIFLSVTGSFTAAVLYDKYHKKRIVQKWCDRVKHVAEQPLQPDTLPRRITIYLLAPPGDGLRPVREHFYEYVKPILVAGALDWDVVEGRREGDVRWAMADRVRRKRREVEGGANEDGDQGETDQELALRQQRKRAGTSEFSGARGDLVLGRHTWKEYVRGLHEGWLGPLQAPMHSEDISTETTASSSSSPSSSGDGAKEHVGDGHAHSTLGDAAVKAAADLASPTDTLSQPLQSGLNTPTTTTTTNTAEASPQPSEDAGANSSENESKEEDTPKPKNLKPPPFISASAYSMTDLPSTLPQDLDPVTVLPFPHILGFLKTPIRIYRFLNRRYLADEIGRQTAALVLAAHTQRLQTDSVSSDMPTGAGNISYGELLQHEEKDWPKRTRERKVDEPGKEDTLLDPIVLDGRVADRMSMWTLPENDIDAGDR